MPPVPLLFDSRASDSPWVDTVWTCRSPRVTEMTSVATATLGLVFWEQDGRHSAGITGPETGTGTAPVPEGASFVGIQFAVGVSLRSLATPALVDHGIELPDVTRRTFRLDGGRWETPGTRRRRGARRPSRPGRRHRARPAGRRRAARRPPAGGLRADARTALPGRDRAHPGRRAADRARPCRREPARLGRRGRHRRRRRSATSTSRTSPGRCAATSGGRRGSCARARGGALALDPAQRTTS